MKLDLSTLHKNSIVSLYNELIHSESAHLDWLHHFNRALLLGSPSLDCFLHSHSHELCVLGKWLINHPTLVSSVKNLDKLVLAHKAMHENAYKIALQKKSSEPISAENFDSFAKTQRETLRLLSGLREDLKSAVYLYDPLTKVYNREIMHTIIRNELERAVRQKSPCSIAMIDIDHFKAVNDAHGHLIGDITLAYCAEFLTKSLRPYDNIFRYGGEEFLLLFPSTELSVAENVVNRICTSVSELSIPIGGSQYIHITVSAGIAIMDVEKEIEDSISNADKALYEAKHAGRNKVVCSW